MMDTDCCQNIDPNGCVICCHSSDEKLNKVLDRGLCTLIESCSKRGLQDLLMYLKSSPTAVYVHNSCRKRFTDSRAILKLSDSNHEDCTSTKRLRSSNEGFDWKLNCFLCSQMVRSKDLNIR